MFAAVVCRIVETQKSRLLLDLKYRNCIAAMFFVTILLLCMFWGATSTNLYFPDHAKGKIIDQFPQLFLYFFVQLLLNNYVLALVLLLGFTTFGLSSIIAIGYNGLVFGHLIITVSNQIGIINTALLVLPHGVIEISWMIMLSVHSINLSFAFWRLLASGLEERQFLGLFFGKQSLLLFAMVIIAAIVEYFITPQVYNCFHVLHSVSLW